VVNGETARPGETPVTTVRLERPEDIATVRIINERAFNGAAEATIVDALRELPGVLSLVAVTSGTVTGHVLFSPVDIERVPEGLKAMGLAPLAVLPEQQRHGLGSALVRKGLDVCRLLGYGFVVVLGHPEYYARFGFSTAADHGLHSEFPAPRESFMVRELTPGVLKSASGLVRYHDAFSRNVESR
jgi:putative acetyltransferase